MDETPSEFRFELAVADHLLEFGQETIDRLAYLYPAIGFSIKSGAVECVSDTPIIPKSLNEDLRYGLYRTKIRAENTVNRSLLYKAVFKG